ncbi:hypothetical protein YC2023_017353 [Brassica napus]
MKLREASIKETGRAPVKSPGEEPSSTPKKGDAETKAGRPSPEGKARTPEAEPADHQEKVCLRKKGPVGESETG